MQIAYSIGQTVHLVGKIAYSVGQTVHLVGKSAYSVGQILLFLNSQLKNYFAIWSATISNV